MSDRPVCRSLAFLSLAALLAAPAVVAAQEGAPPPTPPSVRHGLFGGLALSGGNISCKGEDCDSFYEAGGGGGHIGYMFGPRLGALLDVWALTAGEQNNIKLSYVAASVAVRFWPVPILWVQGGLGSGHATVRWGGLAATSDDVPVAMIGAGVEVVRARHWSLDVEAKLAWGTTTDESNGVSTARMAGLGASFTWFATR